ncbi:MAG: FxLYD domain-containing protein [Clostridia bacterium]
MRKYGNQYLKFEFFSKNDTSLGKKFIKIENLGPNATRDFEVDFNFEEVKSYKITVANSTEIENASDAEFLSDPKTKGFLLLTTLVFLYF